MHIADSDLATLRWFCDIPTAPYHEHFVVAALRHWHQSHGRHRYIGWRCDPAGNIHLDYHQGGRNSRLLVLEAHLDHPAFVVTSRRRDGTVRAIFRGGVKPEFFAGAGVLLWNAPTPSATRPEPIGLPAQVLAVTPATRSQPLRAILRADGTAIGTGAIGTWHLPDAAVHNNLFTARACDDLAGVAACLCVLDRLIQRRAPARVRVLLTRAEEVGFAGAIAAAHQGWIPKTCAVIGLETSRTTAQARLGHGPVIRVGDRSTVFDGALTGFMANIAARVAAAVPEFQFQRALMDGGTCNTTAFGAFGYQTGAVCLALGNYHNMVELPADQGLAAVTSAGPTIASETIDVRDFAGEVELLTALCREFWRFQPGTAALRKKLWALHYHTQRKLLYC
ncbi:MAG: hypothetical protein HKL95_03405 [Phycisphaerae bacterium]|nr:hypothetical protein [Phycisphaerae bacterium]